MPTVKAVRNKINALRLFVNPWVWNQKYGMGALMGIDKQLTTCIVKYSGIEPVSISVSDLIRQSKANVSDPKRVIAEKIIADTNECQSSAYLVGLTVEHPIIGHGKLIAVVVDMDESETEFLGPDLECEIAFPGEQIITLPILDLASPKEDWIVDIADIDECRRSFLAETKIMIEEYIDYRQELIGSDDSAIELKSKRGAMKSSFPKTRSSGRTGVGNIRTVKSIVIVKH